MHASGEPQPGERATWRTLNNLANAQRPRERSTTSRTLNDLANAQRPRERSTHSTSWSGGPLSLKYALSYIPDQQRCPSAHGILKSSASNQFFHCRTISTTAVPI